jgi:hypothetical protein
VISWWVVVVVLVLPFASVEVEVVVQTRRSTTEPGPLSRQPADSRSQSIAPRYSRVCR